MFLLSFIAIILIYILSIYMKFKYKIRNMEKFASQIPGPKGLPFIGNTLQFYGAKDIGMYLNYTYARLCLFLFLNFISIFKQS